MSEPSLSLDDADSLMTLRLAMAYYERPKVLAQTIRWCRSLGIGEVWMFPYRGHTEPAHLLPRYVRERSEIIRRAARNKGSVLGFKC